MSAASPRRAVSPYARRLANERGVQLAEVTGSGPGGRVVAFDILSAPAANAPAAPAAPTAPAPDLATAAAAPAAVAALGATARLDGLNDLLASVTAAGGNVTLQDAFLRAAALALAAHSAGGPATNEAISLETDAGGIVLADIKTLAVGAIRIIREDATPTAEPSAGLSIRFSTSPGVRSVILPLKSGIPMRLALSISRDGSNADCLLVHDSEAVTTDRAEATLGTLIDGLDQPLSLLV
ncbi:MAG: pyruvate/2-oxoglutarate dehydrogenase complex dihydrolipoamide acyltransferase (E2) component [Alphaproteobacteria bacterium]|jgi:pyruvate/2-oxoglutarate dehydrogenase complex dihydrolipoamide acyltransferase (E2) component